MQGKTSIHQHIYCHLKKQYLVNHSIPQPWHTLFAVLYSLVSLFAFLSNLSLLIILCSHNCRRPKAVRNTRGSNRRTQKSNLRARRSTLVVLNKPPKAAEITRDHLIAYLATFDLLLSLTMPFTALDVLTKYWPLGPNTEMLCRLTRSVPSSVVYSSSMIIILIAANCYRQVLNSSKRQLSPSEIRYVLIVIVIVSIIISTPIFYNTKLNPLFGGSFADLFPESTNNEEEEEELGYSEYYYYDAPSDSEITNWTSIVVPPMVQTTSIPEVVSSKPTKNESMMCDDSEINHVNFSDITFCMNDWPINGTTQKSNLRFYYSIFSLCAQLIVPFLVISIAYFAVYRRLKKRAIIQSRVFGTHERVRKKNNRNKRRNKLLTTISLVFLIAWLPLGLFGALSDLPSINIFGDTVETTTIIFMIFHLMGMSSACANPIIYGYRNKHVRKGNINIG